MWWLLALLIGTAHAEPPAGSDGSLAPWFHSLTVPGSGYGCCSMADCRPVEYRMTDDHFEAYIDRKSFGEDAPDAWVRVPDEAILRRHDNPTGQAIACYFIDHILCFVEASGT